MRCHITYFYLAGVSFYFREKRHLPDAKADIARFYFDFFPFYKRQ